MIMRFTTKRDRNGNRKTLTIDHERRYFHRDYNDFRACDYVEVSAKGRKQLIEECIGEGYEEV